MVNVARFSLIICPLVALAYSRVLRRSSSCDTDSWNDCLDSVYYDCSDDDYACICDYYINYETCYDLYCPNGEGIDEVNSGVQDYCDDSAITTYDSLTDGYYSTAYYGSSDSCSYYYDSLDDDYSYYCESTEDPFGYTTNSQFSPYLPGLTSTTTSKWDLTSSPTSTPAPAGSLGASSATARRTSAFPSATVIAAESLQQKNSSHAGAIAGGVVGGVVGAALIAGALFFFCRRRQQPEPEESEKVARPASFGRSWPLFFSKKHDSGPSYELAAGSDPGALPLGQPPHQGPPPPPVNQNANITSLPQNEPDPSSLPLMAHPQYPTTPPLPPRPEPVPQMSTVPLVAPIPRRISTPQTNTTPQRNPSLQRTPSPLLQENPPRALRPLPEQAPQSTPAPLLGPISRSTSRPMIEHIPHMTRSPPPEMPPHNVPLPPSP